MAITVLSKTSPRPVPGGQEGVQEQWFTCAWSTSDTTGTVPSGMRKVLRIKGFAILTSTGIANDVLLFGGTVNGDGSLALDTGQVLTLGRPAGTTSACKFSFGIEGYV
jgi:hypothetical protein